MNTNVFEARKYIAKAREALQRGDKESAQQAGKQAVLLAPKMEDAWLVLTASDPNPRDALAHASKALEINPESRRARRGLEWAQARVQNTNLSSLAGLPKRVDGKTTSAPPLKINSRKWLYPALVIGAGCLFAGLLGLFALTSPALASIVSNVSAPVSTQEHFSAPVYIAKPTITPIDISVFAPQPAQLPTSEPSDVPTSVPMNLPTLAATEAAPVTSEATETPGTLSMEIVADTPTSQSVSLSDEQAAYPDKGNGERWIDVDLSEQRVYAYEGDVVVNSFLVSTGLPETPTVTGRYKIWIKVRIQDMSGPGYYLRDVPYVMYFYEDYGLHGTYWHNNFGTPMSRGCVNLRVDDAAWLFNWASVGTVVNVHD